MSKAGHTHLRRALYMPALVAILDGPNMRVFCPTLLADSKTSMDVLMAFMRMLLHVIYGLLNHRTPFDGAKFYHIPVENP